MTLSEEADAGPVPTELVAVTVKVYGVPLVSPLTLQDSGPLLQLHVLASGLEVTVYEVIVLPQSEAGALQETVASRRRRRCRRGRRGP